MDVQRSNAPAVLAEVMRAGVVESRHLGHVVVVDGDDGLVAALGDPALTAFLRSSAKPFQALPLLATGAAERFGFTDQEVAVACGSHGGEPMHIDAVTSMLEKAGLEASALKCGLHPPFDPAAREALVLRGEEPSVLHNNCSGKHAGMLALAVHLGAPVEGYLEPDHPVQQHVLNAVAEFAALPKEEIAVGADGCGVPTFALPLQATARMFVNLVRPPDTLDEPLRRACERVVRAMLTYPEMVAGTAEGESLDAGLMLAKPGAFVTKVGAEGLFTAAVLPSAEWPTGLGIVLKVEDGDLNRRARGPAAVALFRRLGLLEGADEARLKPYATRPILNHLEEVVGEVRPALRLAPFLRAGIAVAPEPYGGGNSVDRAV